MSLSKEDLNEIIAAVKSTGQKDGCLCGIGSDEQGEMGHFLGRLKDLGSGNLNQGIEIFSKAVGLMASIRRLGERVGGAVAIAILVTVAGGTMTAIWVGIKAIIKRD